MTDTQQQQPSEFPILCDTCLGDNPLVRMQLIPSSHAPACKVCNRPYNNYRWKAGSKGRYKKTEICITCSKLKNLCQCCILDLTYGLPVQVRDTVLDKQNVLPTTTSQQQQHYMLQQYENKINNAIESGQIDANTTLVPSLQSNIILDKIKSTQPNYKRNQQTLCTYYIRGECNRGESCQYRHEMPKQQQLQQNNDNNNDDFSNNNNISLHKQNIRDRYNGVNDPVAMKILQKHNINNNDNHTDNSNNNNTTLYIGNVDMSVNETILRNTFSKYGSIQNIKILHDKHIAFVNYSTHNEANNAIQTLQNNCIVNNKQLNINWANNNNKNTNKRSNNDYNNTVHNNRNKHQRTDNNVNTSTVNT